MVESLSEHVAYFKGWDNKLLDRKSEEQASTDLITALRQGPGSRELSDRMLLVFEWKTHFTKSTGLIVNLVSWISPVNIRMDRHVIGHEESNIERPDPSRSIDDACACGDVSEMSDSQRRLVLKTAIDMFCDALDDEATVKDAARFFCIAILRAKEADG